MATFRQILANRANAAKSTGPKTEEGKARSRANALTHGLAGAGVVFAEEEGAAIDERVRLWAADLRPATPRQHYLARQAALESLRVERCQGHEWALRALEAGKASTTWEADRRLDAEALGEKLARRPSIVARKLASTRQGCDWLIARWEGLAAAIVAGGDWDDAAKDLALDMLGIPPELRAGPSPLAGEPDARLALANREATRLTSLRAEALDDLDAFEREAAEAGFPAAFSRAMTLLHRYERTSSRRVDRALDQLRKDRSSPTPCDLGDFDDSGIAPPVESVPPPPPAPRPMPEAPRPTPTLPTAVPIAGPRPVSMADSLRSQVVKTPQATNRRSRRARYAMA